MYLRDLFLKSPYSKEDEEYYKRYTELFNNIAKHKSNVVDYIKDLEDRVGIQRPCPKCGRPVWMHWVNYDTFSLVCCTVCDYVTEQYTHWQDAWKEHETNCRREDEEGCLIISHRLETSHHIPPQNCCEAEEDM